MKLSTALLLLVLSWPLQARAEGERKWIILPEKSSITFTGKQMGSDFKGSFKSFKADIAFDENDLAHSTVEASVDIASLDTGDKERDKNATGKEWFDAQAFPAARFVSTSFRKAPEKKDFMDVYVAEGTLTIKGVSLPASLPFTLAHAKGGPSTMHGNLNIDRSKFSLGSGDWQDPSIIGNDVQVDIHLSVTTVQ